MKAVQTTQTAFPQRLES